MEKEIKSENPEVFAKSLVAALGADKGVSAIAFPVAGDIRGTWRVITEKINLTKRSNKP